MQISVPDVMDISQEPQHVHEQYGSQPGAASFANNCLLARRLVERGVRYVQLYDWGWDIHGTGTGDDIMTALPKKCKDMDRPVAALLKDLKQRGLLDETLVDLGRRVRPHGDERGARRLEVPRPRPSSALLHASGWPARGIKPGVTLRRDRRAGLLHRPRRRRPSTTCRPRSCTCWASIPGSSPIPFQGLQQRLIGPEGEAKVRREILA